MNRPYANPEKTQVTAFHLRNKEANRSLKVVWNETELENNVYLKNLGVTLDSYKQHIQNTELKVATRNNQLTKLATSMYYQNDSFSMELLYVSVCSSSLCKTTSCQEHGPRTKPSMPISHRMSKANQR